MPNIAPLDADEVDLAVRLTSEDERLSGMVGARSRTVLVQPTTIDRKEPDDARHAVVGFYDYDSNRSLVAVVDLGAREVRAVEETPVQFQLSQEEKQEAQELVAGDQRAREFLADRDMNPLTRLFFPSIAGKDDPPHRYAVVFLLPSASERRFAVVDLTDRQVVDFFGPERLTVQ
jgi:Cu2+-containing amine oxidase